LGFGGRVEKMPYASTPVPSGKRRTSGDGDKLNLKSSMPSQVIANRVWDVIKQVDPQYSDLHHEIATTGGPNQSHSVKSGDNLSKISNRFYGSLNHYSNIAAASNILTRIKFRLVSKSVYPYLHRS
jgi:hypothetical protein